jgi:hypothetical protein
VTARARRPAFRPRPGHTIAVALLAFVMPAAAPVLAQSCTTNPGSCSPPSNPLQISITIGRAVQVLISPGNTTLTPPGPADYDAGFVATNGPTVTVRSNAPWSVALSSSTSTWIAVNTQSEPARTDKPASDLQWAFDQAGPFTDMSTSPATLANGALTTATSVTLFYRTRYSWVLDTPGNYRLPLVFTIIAP